MLTTYDRYLRGPQVTRYGGYTYDNRDLRDRLKSLEAEIEALRRYVAILERVTTHASGHDVA